MESSNGLVNVTQAKTYLPKEGAIFIPNCQAVDLFSCSMIVLDAKQSQQEIREGAIFVPKVLKGKGYQHWSQVSTFLNLVVDIDPNAVSGSKLRAIFIVSASDE
ncbi:hypothetical protein F896_02376 [Acinetobacter genomosp. 15BJ]|nr:hypothetical protein F896_02376 [Acinetobacter genomosp. 15BJ]